MSSDDFGCVAFQPYWLLLASTWGYVWIEFSQHVPNADDLRKQASVPLLASRTGWMESFYRLRKTIPSKGSLGLLTGSGFD